jgi:SAM-dependent methyltransferase
VLLVDSEGKNYHRCRACAATFLEPAEFLTAEVELAHYLTHQNDLDDQGYRAYLAKLANPLLARIQPNSKGLDFGCGPASALAAMLGEAGHTMSIYDPFFADDPACLGEVYDFVTCTETAEHFHYPDIEFKRLRGLVRPGGLLAVMTIFQTDDALFENWRYRHDPTHVVFYREQTFRYLAAKLGMTCDIIAKDVVFLTRPR